mmetsp:Transcript_19636/g.40411  ORF Transcript_19636/g.40411 Transcript_19636/m.40411 type:complete len:397 (+) Transcript_19636:121-1311(+)
MLAASIQKRGSRNIFSRQLKAVIAVSTFFVGYVTISPSLFYTDEYVSEDASFYARELRNKHKKHHKHNLKKRHKKRIKHKEQSTHKEHKKIFGGVSVDDNLLAKAEFESNNAIALISFGESAAESTLLERCVLSIRRRGQFDGHVVVITDAPEERYDGVFDENVIVLKANEDDILYDYFQAPSMKYKRFKTLLIKYINSVPELDSIDWLYYMDIDMMLGAPFMDMILELRTKYDIDSAHDADSALYFFKDLHAEEFALNGGFMIINRHTSGLCLDVWREEIERHQRASFDQTSINAVIANKESNHCSLEAMEVENYVTFPKDDKALTKARLWHHHSPLIHIFNTWFASKESPEVMEEYVADVLRLSEEEKEEHKFGKSVITPSREKWTGSNEVNDK